MWVSAFHELGCWTVYRESELTQGSSLCSSFFRHDFLTMMDCTLILWANKSLSFHKIATVLCFVLTRKVAKTAMDQKGTFIYVIYVSKEFMNHFESTCMKKNSRLRLLGVSRYWKPWFLILWAMNHMGSHNECQDHKTSGNVKRLRNVCQWKTNSKSNR